MAVYFQNTLLRTSDYVKISTRYSSLQSLWRGKKRGNIALKKIGGIQFAPANAEEVSRLYSVESWEGLEVIPAEQLPANLDTLSRISKTVGVGEAVLLEWAFFGRIDAYWVAGTFFANLRKAKGLSALQKTR